MKAALVDAAKECQQRFPTIRVEAVDHYGRLTYTFDLPGTEVEGFVTCYQAKVREKRLQIAEPGRVVIRPGPATAMSVPIEAAGRHVHVVARLNDHATATLLLDTGSTSTFVSPAVAARAGLSVPSAAVRWPITVAGGTQIFVPFTRLSSISIGDARVEDLDVGIYDILPHHPGVDGILGQDFLGHFAVTLDRDARRLGLVARVATPASAPVTGPAAERSWEVPQWRIGDEWRYRWETPTGSGTVVWVVKGEEIIDDVEYWVIDRGSGTSYYAKGNLGWHMDKRGQNVVSRAVPSSGYAWPLRVGRTWDRTYRHERPAQRETTEVLRRCGVTALEEITVAAGTFQALHVVCRYPDGRDSSEEWYAPDVKLWVKTRTFLRDGIRVWELLSYRLR